MGYESRGGLLAYPLILVTGLEGSRGKIRHKQEFPQVRKIQQETNHPKELRFLQMGKTG